MDKDLFPLSVAKGIAFCNRKAEREKLRAHIDVAAHTVLLAPRRYGKTSLSRTVCETWAAKSKSNVYIDMSMLAVWNENVVVEKIAEGVGEAIAEMLPMFNAVELKKFAASMDGIGLKLKIGLDGFEFDVSGSLNRENPAASITSIGKMLKKLDEIAKERGFKVVLEIDEFQEISRLEHSHSIEAEIRDAIQHASNVVCIFLGSNRRMLEAMFTGRERPFYKMCHIMRLERIELVHYHAHLEDMARAQWGHSISLESIETILSLTECHPYYVNRLCFDLWHLDSVPSKITVEAVWLTVVRDEEPAAVSLLTELSLSQKAVVSQLAKSPTKEITGKRFLISTNLASSTARTAKQQLEKDDVIYSDEDGVWRVMNPCLATYLK